MNTQETTTLDIRTLLLVMMEEEVPRERIFNLIAREMNVPVERLINALTTNPKGSGAVKYTKWTDERLNELVHRWNNGEKPSQIASAMGVNVQVVYQRIMALRKVRNDIKSRKSNLVNK